MLGGGSRFLTRTTAGTLAADYLPDDREQRELAAVRAVPRSDHSQFDARTEGALRVNYVSTMIISRISAAAWR